MAIIITIRLKETLEGRREATGCPENIYCHCHESNLENGCDVLWKLGVATAVISGSWSENSQIELFAYDATQKKYSAYYAFMNTDEIRTKIISDLPLHSPAISTIIDAYLGLETDLYGKEKELPVGRGEFFELVRQRDLSVFKVFVENGYATQSDDKFCWTDKIASMMLKLFLWNERTLDTSQVENTIVLQNVSKILKSLTNENFGKPRKKISNLNTSWRAREILLFWDGEVWRKSKLLEPKIQFDNALKISMELEKEFNTFGM